MCAQQAASVYSVSNEDGSLYWLFLLAWPFRIRWTEVFAKNRLVTGNKSGVRQVSEVSVASKVGLTLGAGQFRER